MTQVVKIEKPTSKDNYLHAIKYTMEPTELIKHLEMIVGGIKKKHGSSFLVKPSPSSQSTGLRWTWDAFVNNIKSVLNITPNNTAAVKEASSLPVKQQLYLLNSISEQLLSKRSPVNDRNNTFETVMNILGGLTPEYQALISVISQPLLNSFHDDFRKPFVNYVGHQYRTADGSQNSLILPDVGKAGSYYAKTVRSSAEVNTNLPSAQTIFDRLLKRREGDFTPHKSGINMLLFYLAIIITHDLFYTDSKDPQRNLTTSYADLSVLYGKNREEQESVRQMKHGLLKPDQWFDRRLVIQPRGVSALMVVFSRNHNYIARTLLEKNENGMFSFGPGLGLADEAEQDEKLFQTARLVNNGCYANVILHDYLRTILGTQVNSNFVLDPLANAEMPLYGNAISIEFNVIYRWHAGIGKHDSDWLQEVMTVLMKEGRQKQPDVPKDEIDRSYFDVITKKFVEHFVHATPEELQLGNPIATMHRQGSGQFLDKDILGALKEGYYQQASEVGNGLNTPAALEHVEIAGINHARKLGVCTMNEFRKSFNLVTLDTWEDFSEKKEVQEALKELYGTPDSVELYTGLMVERVKETGLRLPYTMSRAILSDATNLLRNDRILATELTPQNLTNWGYHYMKGNPKDMDRVLPGMLVRLFPDSDQTSIGFTPEELETLFKVPERQ
ncbi:heme peroxidase [Sporodiniella umbellata]|nr:heme peroxidase [Sporodiniella umbellata]